MGYVPWPANRFRGLSTLALGLVEAEHLHHLPSMLEDSPRLEYLFLRRCVFRTPVRSHVASLQHPVKVHHLKAFSLAGFTVEIISELLQSLSFPQHGLAMRFGDIRTRDPEGIVHFARIFPSDFPPDLSMFDATSLDLQITRDFCTFHAVGHHAATAIQWVPSGRLPPR